MSIVKIRAALETALNSMVGVIPDVTILSFANGTITTTSSHGFKTGISVTISGQPLLDGEYFVVVTSLTAFTLQHSVTKAPIASTASGVGGVIKANLTAWDNVGFASVPGVPYQRVFLLWGETENPTMDPGHSREIGIMQVNLNFPTQEGTRDSAVRAELIRSTFKKGYSFTFEGVTVKILKKPYVMTGQPSDESYILPVRIPFQADVFE